MLSDSLHTLCSSTKQMLITHVSVWMCADCDVTEAEKHERSGALARNAEREPERELHEANRVHGHTHL